MEKQKKITKVVQCCFCKNKGSLHDDFHNVAESSRYENEEEILINHIASGCWVCKQIYERNQRAVV